MRYSQEAPNQGISGTMINMRIGCGGDIRRSQTKNSGTARRTLEMPAVPQFTLKEDDLWNR